LELGLWGKGPYGRGEGRGLRGGGSFHGGFTIFGDSFFGGKRVKRGNLKNKRPLIFRYPGHQFPDTGYRKISRF